MDEWLSQHILVRELIDIFQNPIDIQNLKSMIPSSQQNCLVGITRLQANNSIEREDLGVMGYILELFKLGIFTFSPQGIKCTTYYLK